jgi:hypothetical protein
MTTPTTWQKTAELDMLLRAELLSDLGLVDVGGGSHLGFELAVRFTLSELARLAALENDGCRTDPSRWDQLKDDVERLHRLATMTARDRTRV